MSIPPTLAREPPCANPPNSKTRTRDMGGSASTHEYTKAILTKMEEQI